MSFIREKSIQGLKKGDSFTITRTFTEQDMADFADMSKDYNPVHFNREFARIKNFKERICHGLLVGSMLTEIGGQIGWLASGMDFRFRKPVYFNDTISCTFTITEIDERGWARAEVVWENQDGERVIESDLTGILPGIPEKNVMKKMMAGTQPTGE